MARPSIGVVTAVQPVHLSRIGSLDAVERAKGELLEALPADGMAILNADDPIVTRMDARSAARPLRYGFSERADVRAEAVTSAGIDGMRFRLQTPAGERPVAIPVLGRLSVHNALAGAAVGLAAGLDLDTIVTGLRGGWAAPHRAELVRLRGTTIVDDSYNASPGSVVAALELLAGLPGRRVAVLGTMLELGDGHDAGHVTVGETAGRTVELLVVVGPEASGIVEGARSSGLDAARIHHVGDVDEALDVLRPRLQDGDAILVKASRGIGLDRLVDALRLEIGEAGR
jgi:UDP-N-acetylmuramoyl-tripeptide--D-alanyl-D-alanine ligase